MGWVIGSYLQKGKLKHVLNTGVDVTERVVGRKIIEKQKAELEEQRQELEAIIENLSDEVIIFDKNGNFNIINKATRKNAIYDVEKTKNITELSKLNILYDLCRLI